MHQTNSSRFQHSHDYSFDTSVSESRTRIVIAITASMMIAEIVAGVAFNSMALLADGWHMSTHVAAFFITILAYHFSRRHANDPRYSFGTGKMGVLGGFASTVILFMIALLMSGESLHRFFNPTAIQFNDAIVVAAIGLVVNVVCALLLKDDHHHGHSHGDSHSHDSGGHDLNRRAAYIHVLADALTSVTAIVALLAGKFYGWSFLDPVMGVVGSVVVALWAFSLMSDTSGILLDRTPESCDLAEEIHRAVGSDGNSHIADLHIWQVASGRFAAIVSIVGDSPKSPEEYRNMFSEHEELVHTTIEVQHYQVNECA
jgi:cation diffusion facilitator family transporter